LVVEVDVIGGVEPHQLGAVADPSVDGVVGGDEAGGSAVTRYSLGAPGIGIGGDAQVCHSESACDSPVPTSRTVIDIPPSVTACQVLTSRFGNLRCVGHSAPIIGPTTAER
jgi:hypothetical protein